MKYIIATCALVLSLMLPAFADEALPDTALTETVTLYVDINTDGAEKLADLLVGVGAARAQAIIDYRQENGPFTSLEELLNVPGIGPATLSNNQDRIRL